jgi:hypothetical protein
MISFSIARLGLDIHGTVTYFCFSTEKKTFEWPNFKGSLHLVFHFLYLSLNVCIVAHRMTANVSAYCVWLILKTNLSHVCERNYETKTTIQHRTSQMKYAHVVHWAVSVDRYKTTSLCRMLNLCRPTSQRQLSTQGQTETVLCKPNIVIDRLIFSYQSSSPLSICKLHGR